MTFAFFDFEATDKDPKTARITELGVALYNEKGKMFHAYTSTLYNESYPPISETAAAITGIDDQYLKKCGSDPSVELGVFCGLLHSADIIVGHNCRNFDLQLLKAELDRLAVHTAIPEKQVVDTRYDLPIPDHIETRKLPYLALEHGIVALNAHTALADVITTASLFFHYDTEKVLERARSPNLWIRADVTFDTRELAKERKFMWDGVQKIWVKEIKLCDYEKEESNAKFRIIKLNNYKAQV